MSIITVGVYIVLALLNLIVGCTSGATKAAAPEGAAKTSDSGFEGTTHWKVMSGVPGGQTTGGSASIEFAIAPVENDRPSYNKAVFVKSDNEGRYKIFLPPGKYWIGARDKALDPNNYVPRSSSVSEDIVVVEPGRFTKIDVVQVGHAP